jgi:hypothetical protein
LLAGGFRDPLVGRDVLAGCLLCSSTTVLGSLLWFVPAWLGYAPAQPGRGPDWQFLGARTVIADMASIMIGAPIFWLAALFVLVLLRALLRKQWAAAVAWVLLFSVFSTAQSQFAPFVVLGTLVFFGLAVFCLIRFGLLTLITNFVFYYVLGNYPLTTQGSAFATVEGTPKGVASFRERQTRNRAKGRRFLCRCSYADFLSFGGYLLGWPGWRFRPLVSSPGSHWAGVPLHVLTCRRLWIPLWRSW